MLMIEDRAGSGLVDLGSLKPKDLFRYEKSQHGKVYMVLDRDGLGSEQEDVPFVHFSSGKVFWGKRDKAVFPLEGKLTIYSKGTLCQSKA